MRETLEMAERMKAISALVITVQGAMTEPWYALAGPTTSRFHRMDAVGLQLARQAGWRVALVTDLAAEEFGGLTAQVEGLEVLPTREAVGRWVDLGQVAYLGADLLDLPAMMDCQLSATPCDGALLVRRRSNLILESGGGAGAVRELVERLLVVQNRIGEVLREWYVAHGYPGAAPWLEEVAAEAGGALGKIGFRH